MANIFQEVRRLLEDNRKMVLVTLVHQIGSTPRSTGSRCIVLEDGTLIGTIGGGKMEYDAVQAARSIFDSGTSRLVHFEFTHSDMAKSDMICGGKADIFLEPVFPENKVLVDLYRNISETLKKGGRGVLYSLIEEGLPFMADNTKTFISESEELESVQAGLPPAPEMAEPEEKQMFIETIKPDDFLYLFGAGHVSTFIAPVAHMVGFHVVVIDDREEFANKDRFPDAEQILAMPFSEAFDAIHPTFTSSIVIVTRGHIHDKAVLRKALETPASYIGMIGSSRKRKLIYKALEEEGITRDQLDSIYSPIGLSIGSETPEEIAVSIVAELIKVRAERNKSDSEASKKGASGGKLHLQTLHKGDPPPCLKKVVQCRGCNGWKPMLKAAKEIPLWQKYPFGCSCTGLTVKYVGEE